MKLLIVDDEKYIAELLRSEIKKSIPELTVFISHTTEEALELSLAENIHVMILDKHLTDQFHSKDPKDNGIEAIPLFLAQNSRLRILVHTSSNNIKDVVRAMKLGATNYIPKEASDEALSLVMEQISSALEQARVLEKNMRLTLGDRSENLSPVFVTKTPVMRATLEKLKKFAETHEPILLLGETGTGKTTLSEIAHKIRFKENANAPFISKAFTSVATNVIESELFGSIRGAFTDAIDRVGFFEAANGGTLFIDEIGDLSLETQSKILTTIETGIFHRVGESTRQRKSNFRLICATNKNPEELVATGKMREDFYARICALQLEVPSLKERSEDIPHIVENLLRVLSGSLLTEVTLKDLPEDFLLWLKENPPKLNVRGLRHLLVELIVLSPRDKYGLRDYTQWRATLMDSKVKTTRSNKSKKLNWRDYLGTSSDFLTPDFPGWKSFSRELEAQMITQFTGSIPELSKITRISTATLYRRRDELLKKDKDVGVKL
jgi:DNA-binding NtrC family response regulator